jgi:3-phenylpropionate/trans-cinnamate dioxygenase ferredoxin reductase subunit
VTSSSAASVIVVGGGLAGANVAFRLRELGYRGGIILVGREKHQTYDRPPLSKEVLLSMDDPPGLPFDWDGLDVDLRLGTEAKALRRRGAGWAVETARGEAYADRVVIATGARPRPLPVGWRCASSCDGRPTSWSLAPGGSAPKWPRRPPRSAAA